MKREEQQERQLDSISLREPRIIAHVAAAFAAALEGPQLKRTADGRAILFRVSRADLRSWLGEPMPVILVVYDAQADAAYWLYVQAEFEKRPALAGARASQTVTVRIPRSQRPNPSAVRAFARYKDHVLAQQVRLVHHE